MSDRPESFEEELGVPFPGAILPPEQWAKTAIKKLPETGPLDWEQVFQRRAPAVLEIGCGNGRFIVSSALRRPELNHVGIDVLPMVIRYATRRANQRGLHHARLAVCDGGQFLKRYQAAQSLDEIHIYHPQPYREPGQQKNRLLAPEFLGLLFDRLTAGGQIYLQTDNREYWSYFEAVMPALFQWHHQEGPWQEDPYGRSRREIIATQKGLTIFRGWGVKRSELTESDVVTTLASLPEPDFEVRQPKNRTGWQRPRRKSRRQR